MSSTHDEQIPTEPLRSSFPPWVRRLLVTLLLIAVYRIGMQLPLPGTAELWKALPDSDYGPGGAFDLSRASIFTLGILPYFSASILLLLASGVIPGLRRIRDAEDQEHRGFPFLLLALTGVLAVIQGVGIAFFLDDLRSRLIIAHPASLAGLRLTITISLTAGAFLAVWIAHAISRHGLGNGMAIILFFAMESSLPARIRETVHDGGPGAASPVAAFALLLLAIIAAVFLVTARRTFRLDRPESDERESRESPPRPVVSLRLQPAGGWPLSAAGYLLGHLFIWIAFLTSLFGSRALLPGGVVVAITIVLTLFLSLLFASWIFSARDLSTRLARHGLRAFDAEGRMLDERDLERVQERAAWLGSGLLCAFAVISLTIGRSETLSPGVAGLVSPMLIIGVATALQVIGNLRRWRAADDRTAWTPVASFDVGLDALLAQETLRAAGIPVVAHDAGAGIVTGSPAPWESCRPHYPALVVYRRFAGGGTELHVPTARAKEGRRLLAADDSCR